MRGAIVELLPAFDSLTPNLKQFLRHQRRKILCHFDDLPCPQPLQPRVVVAKVRHCLRGAIGFSCCEVVVDQGSKCVALSLTFDLRPVIAPARDATVPCGRRSLGQSGVRARVSHLRGCAEAGVEEVGAALPSGEKGSDLP